MFERISPFLHSTAAVAALSGLLLAAPALAQTTPPATSGQTTTAPAAKAPHAKRSRADRVEARIKQLHDALHITDAQSGQWNAVAQTMRDNAATMDKLLQDRAATIKTASAVDDLRSYQTLADAHAEGLRKFVPAFETLYASLSDDQKKAADELFRSHQRRARGKRSSG
jgi:protein CpxP